MTHIQAMVLRTDKPDATEADVEQWAAQAGCIVANLRHIPAGTTVEFLGRTLESVDGCHVWIADVVIAETLL